MIVPFEEELFINTAVLYGLEINSITQQFRPIYELFTEIINQETGIDNTIGISPFVFIFLLLLLLFCIFLFGFLQKP